MDQENFTHTGGYLSQSTNIYLLEPHPEAKTREIQRVEFFDRARWWVPHLGHQQSQTSDSNLGHLYHTLARQQHSPNFLTGPRFLIKSNVPKWCIFCFEIVWLYAKLALFRNIFPNKKFWLRYFLAEVELKLK